MDFKSLQKLDQFRAEVRDFLQTNLPANMAERGRRGYPFLSKDIRRWTAILHERGWSVPSWPVQFGGTGWTLRQRLVFEECCYLAGAPQLSTQGVSLVGPVIYTVGTDWQKERFLPGIRSGTELWAQGFSEPDSGSDLASLRTAAVRDGDDWLISGRKIWTSQASDADFIFLLARSESTGRPQEGISFFLVPTDAAGLTIRPIRSIDGSDHLHETLYEEVRIPAQFLLGEAGKGWTYAKNLLSDERAFSAEIPRNRAHLAKLMRIATSIRSDGFRPLDDPLVAARIVELHAELDALEFLTMEALDESADATHVLLPPALKIKGSEMQQRLLGLAVELLGPDAFPFYPNPREDDLPCYAADRLCAPGTAAAFLFRCGASIAGGTNEIQRNIISKALLR